MAFRYRVWRILFLFTLVSIIHSGVEAQGAADFVAGPYLVFNGARGAMTVMWQADSTPASSTIEWGLTQSYENGPILVYENSSAANEHLFEYMVSGVDDNVTVYYRVRVDGNTAIGSFRTAPPADQTNVVFYGYGDIRGNLSITPGNYYDHDMVEQAIMRDVENDATNRQTFTVNVGDFVYSGLSEDYWHAQYFNRSLLHSLFFQANLPVMAQSVITRDTSL